MSTVLYCTVPICTALFYTVLYCTALYYTVRHCLTCPVLHCCTAPPAQVTSIDLPDICRSACFSPNGHLIALGLGTYALCTDSLFLTILCFMFYYYFCFILRFYFFILYRWISPSITYRHSLLVVLHFADCFLLLLLTLLHCTGGSVRGVNRPSPRPYDGHVVIVSYLQGK